MKVTWAFCFCLLARTAHALEIDDYFDQLRNVPKQLNWPGVAEIPIEPIVTDQRALPRLSRYGEYKVEKSFI